MTTRRGKLMEISLKTGALVQAFGDGGILDTKTPDVMNGFSNAPYGFSAPPAVIGDVIVTGSRVQENPTQGPSGDVRGWDARTGKALWTFHTIARPGEPGHETWEGDSWLHRSGVNVWNVPIGDAKRGIVYLPIGAPTFDRWGGDRHGANLYSNAVVALDAHTGKFLWHFQTVHHDVWDLDLPSITLIEVRKNGRTIPAIAAMNKTSVLFMLDRVTGKPLFDVREVPVPTDTDIPGEQIWPTQPMSVTPPLARVTYAAGDIAAVTPELKTFCEQLVKDKTVTPSRMFQPLRTDSAVASFPSSLGGIDWGGAAFDPGRGVYVANSNNLGALAQMIRQPDGSYAMKDGYLYFWNPQTHQPCNAPPWGNLSAIDVNSGKILWQVTLGISDDLPPGQQETGRFNIGNPTIPVFALSTRPPARNCGGPSWPAWRMPARFPIWARTAGSMSRSWAPVETMAASGRRRTRFPLLRCPPSRTANDRPPNPQGGRHTPQGSHDRDHYCQAPSGPSWIGNAVHSFGGSLPVPRFRGHPTAPCHCAIAVGDIVGWPEDHPLYAHQCARRTGQFHAVGCRDPVAQRAR
jgi:glucose dehydrogenase